LDLKNKGVTTGKIIFRVDKPQESRTFTTFNINSSNLKNVRGFFDSTISPYLKFYKQKQGTDEGDKFVGNILKLLKIISVLN
jgi:hypothetical protein